MKIALIGYGKMGRMIEEIAINRGHEITCIVDAGEEEKFASEAFRRADVAIEFTVPSAAVQNILHSFAAGVPVVCGTTGWLNDLEPIAQICREGKGSLLHSTNFSIGVNIFRAVNRHLAHIMNQFPQYKPELTEIHHIHKLDHPSGTAITLAEELIAESDNLVKWEEPCDGQKECCGVEVKETILPVWHERQGEVPGTHSITWRSDVDQITITHEAFSRRGFALGAVIAAEWLPGQPKNIYTINDLFKL